MVSNADATHLLPCHIRSCHRHCLCLDMQSPRLRTSCVDPFRVVVLDLTGPLAPLLASVFPVTLTHRSLHCFLTLRLLTFQRFLESPKMSLLNLKDPGSRNMKEIPKSLPLMRLPSLPEACYGQAPVGRGGAARARRLVMVMANKQS